MNNITIQDDGKRAVDEQIIKVMESREIPVFVGSVKSLDIQIAVAQKKLDDLNALKVSIQPHLDKLPARAVKDVV